MPEPGKPEQRHESPIERLLASLQELSKEPTSKGTHFYRTSFRRFQAWNDVFHPPIERSQKRALKVLDKVRRAAGKLRDSEVHRELLQQLAADDSPDKKKLERALKERRNFYEKKLTRLLQDAPTRQIENSLRSMEKRTGGKKQVHDSPGMVALALEKYRAFVQRHGKVTPDNLHEYRLECKRFRYTAELAGDTAEANDLVESWKGVQDAIGEWHDYLTLAAVADEVLGKSDVRSALRERVKQKFEQSCEAIENVERKLITEAAPKKKPRAASTARKSRAA